MYLTKENLRTIEKYLAEKGVKDSHFPAIENATGDEYLVISTVSGNKRIRLKSIVNLLESNISEETLEKILSGIADNADAIEELSNKVEELSKDIDNSQDIVWNDVK